MALKGSGDRPLGGGDGQQAEEQSLAKFVCPVCLEIYETPIVVKCGHIFCNMCLQQCLKPKKPVCGVCRSPLVPGQRAVDLEQQIEMTEANCRGCGMKVPLSKMRAHAASCSKYQNYIMEGVRAASKDQPANARSIPNRYTFACPYCNEKNFDQEGLAEHCTKCHSMDGRQVVCPICASMPWGNPNYRSADFMQHLQRRHRFSYDTFVDYEVDEDVMMQEALARSLMDR
ncbi:E3 ubiquitin-protein ligase RNF114 [Latimeria chalumnae]|uniref:E3 ubiquitin-protein ligase RNF114 n=1 Tax=Latimeria chalumnae TaxID=7897 RepID=UPI00313F0C06